MPKEKQERHYKGESCQLKAKFEDDEADNVEAGHKQVDNGLVRTTIGNISH